MEVHFAGAEFRADPGRCTVSGLLIEWDTVTAAGGRRWRFRPGSLYWSATNRVKLNREHERGELIGVATDLSESPRGLHGTFKVARIPEGDEVLSMAADGILDGFSVEVSFGDGDDHGPDPQDPSVTLVRRGRLTGVAMTGVPAFDNARLESVAASRDNRLEVRLDDAEAEGVRMAAEQAGVSMMELVRGQLRHFTSQRPVYSLDASGSTPSMIRDLWVMNHPTDGDQYASRERLAAHETYMRTLRAQFAAQTTSTASAIVPPGFRPLLASVEADRPFWAAAAKGDLADATPFVCPGDLSEASVTSGAATHVEGTNPSDGSLAFTAKTVTPTGISGQFRVTRELFDSSNPAVDGIAMTVMREDWNREAETRIYTELNGANGQGGTITGDTVPSGAMARTSAGATLPADLRKALGLYGEYRKTRPRSVIASTRSSVSAALETLDSSTVPAGSEDMWVVNGCGVRLSPWVTGVAAGDGDLFVLGYGDLWAWSSPLLEFQYREVGGPALVTLALYGYFATRLVKPSGLASIRHT